MPNIAAVLREEISRLSRKEVRSQVDATKRATTQHRRHIATLKRQVAHSSVRSPCFRARFSIRLRRVDRFDHNPPAVCRQGTSFAAQAPGSIRNGLRETAGSKRADDLQLGTRAGISAHRATFEAGGASWNREASSGRKIEAAAFREGPDPAQELAIERSKEQLAGLVRDSPFANVSVRPRLCKNVGVEYTKVRCFALLLASSDWWKWADEAIHRRRGPNPGDVAAGVCRGLRRT